VIDYTQMNQLLSGGVHVHADPLVHIYNDYLSAEECDHIVELARPRLERSAVASEGQRKISDVRTNDCTFLAHACDPIVNDVVRRIAALIQIPLTHAEDLQVVYYREGQEYKPHQDAFDPDNSNYKPILKKAGQRVVTVLMYLNDVQNGGGTGFPHLDLEIKARRGRIVIFQTCKSASIEPHPLSLHGGLPVGKENDKWAANLWFRERAFQQNWIATHKYSRVFN
jgi:prolyl 4-hydroxylase